MKIHIEKSKAESGGERASRRFGVRQGPMLLKMLSSLYSDPKRAVVREYGTNMLDAYARFPKDAPRTAPQIILPTKLNPTITFKDFGRGMSYDEVWLIFGDYNATTKGDNNVEIGGLGVGGKCAICYAGDQSWIIESRFNGTRYIFHVMPDSEGWPTLYDMGSVPTDEPNGVTVIIPVRDRDFGDFCREVTWFAPYFPMELEVIGSDWKMPTLDYTLRGTNWGLKSNTVYRHGTSNVVMGNIPYEIDWRQIAGKIGLTDQHHNDFSVDLYVPVGSCDIAPNREALMYTDRTIARLKEAVAEFLGDFKRSAEEQIADATTKWEALTRLHSVTQYKSLRASLGSVQWRGQILDVSQGIYITLDKLREMYPEATISRVGRNPMKRRSSALRHASVESVRLYPSHKQYVFVNDVPTGVVYRLLNFGRDHCHGDHTEVFAITGLTEAQLAPYLHGFEIEGRTSKLDGPPKVERMMREKTVAEVMRHVSGWRQTHWEGTTVPVANATVYVRLSGNEPMDFSSSDSEFVAFRDTAIRAGLLAEGVRVYGVPRKSARLEKLPNWTELKALARAELAKVLAAEGQALVDYASWAEVIESPLAKFFLGLNTTKLPKKSLGFRVIAATQAMHKNRLRLASLLDVCSLLEIELPKLPVQNDGAKLFAEFKTAYPMMQFVDLADVAAEDEHHKIVLDYLAA